MEKFINFLAIFIIAVILFLGLTTALLTTAELVDQVNHSLQGE